MFEKTFEELFFCKKKLGLYSTVKLYSYFFIKRLFDLIISFIGLIILMPISILVKICYVITGDFNKILITQERIGKNGKIFKFYKFRSMVVNADEILEEILQENGPMAKEYKKNKKIQDDPRITKVGEKIRKFSIDELPQVINVFLGDMSLIGNRPYLPREKDDMGDYYKDIVKTKPGLSGYWQVNGRSNCSFKERLKLEQYYSNHFSLLLDIKIFLKTFKVVIFGKDAK